MWPSSHHDLATSHGSLRFGRVARYRSSVHAVLELLRTKVATLTPITLPTSRRGAWPCTLGRTILVYNVGKGVKSGKNPSKNKRGYRALTSDNPLASCQGVMQAPWHES